MMDAMLLWSVLDLQVTTELSGEVPSSVESPTQPISVGWYDAEKKEDSSRCSWEEHRSKHVIKVTKVR